MVNISGLTIVNRKKDTMTMASIFYFFHPVPLYLYIFIYFHISKITKIHRGVRVGKRESESGWN